MTKKSKVFTVLAAIWGLFIFANSLQNGTASTKLSDSVVSRLPGWLSWFDLHTLTVLVRKSAHFCEYAMLAVLVCLAFHHSSRLRWKNAGNVLFPCLLWSVCDEFLQTFVEGRTGLIRDVMIDFSGVLSGCAAAVLGVWLWGLYRKKKG